VERGRRAARANAEASVDIETGEYVVIELKKGRSADKVYGQCSRYMGWVRKNLAPKAASVRGVIVARKIDDKLKAARTPTTLAHV
jgi:RecB family endonuclease NucS